MKAEGENRLTQLRTEKTSTMNERKRLPRTRRQGGKFGYFAAVDVSLLRSSTKSIRLFATSRRHHVGDGRTAATTGAILEKVVDQPARWHIDLHFVVVSRFGVGGRSGAERNDIVIVRRREIQNRM